MSQQKFVAIGDIHGCDQTLEALLDELESFADREFVFIGDYIDRGPDSKKVVDLLIEFNKQHNCIFLRGNHEQMLIDAYMHKDPDLWLMNGGKSTLRSYGATFYNFSLPTDHREFYNQTKPYYDTEQYFFVHAGLSPSKSIADSLKSDADIKEFFWTRSHLNAMETAWEKTVVFGHTPKPEPINRNGMIGLDTGCVYRSPELGKLTAVLLPEKEFIQQKSIEN